VSGTVGQVCERSEAVSVLVAGEEIASSRKTLLAMTRGQIPSAKQGSPALWSNSRRQDSFFQIQWLVAGVLLVLAVLLGAWQRASAQDPTPTPAVDTSGITDDQVNAIARTLYCPVCENIPLDVCGTQACDQWRALIRQKLAEGWSAQQIRDYFALNFGDRVLAEPPRRGLNWLVYLLPPLFFLLGAYLVYRVLRSARIKPVPGGPATPQAADTGSPPLEEDYLKRMEEELQRRESSG